jgi:hypothetical protein
MLKLNLSRIMSLTQDTSSTSPIPPKVLTLSRKVDECRSLIPGGGRDTLGKAVQVVPMKPMLKVPGTKRLTTKM